ncbi:transposase [Kitasatospora griseola]|uniref:transposase n=1 Tax=Kitasatospora griseola TaxID=2064 RepID=UPI003829F487
MSLADARWAGTEPLLPDRVPRRGGRWRDRREVIDAIAFEYRAGTPWADLSERFGSWEGVHNRLRMWALDGAWVKVFTALLARAGAEGDLDWVVAVARRSCARTSVLPGPGKRGPAGRAAGSCLRMLLRRTGDERPPGRRRAVQAARFRDHARPGR